MSAAHETRAKERPSVLSAVPSWRMVRAEFLKVRKRQGLLTWSLILTVGAITLAFGTLAILHASNGVRYGPAGGIRSLTHAEALLSMLGAVAAVLIGAAMGAGDLEAGVFRDLVATGRSRTSLFLARIPGGLALLWLEVAGAWTVASVASVVFAGPLVSPGIAVMVEGGAWALLATGSAYLLGLGLASLMGSRSTTVGVFLAWQLALTPLILAISRLGFWREGVLGAALDRLIPAQILDVKRPDPVSAGMSLAVAILVIAAWGVVPLLAGEWRTRTRDA